MNNQYLYLFGTTILERLTFLIFYILLTRVIGQTEFGFIVTIFAFLNILNGFLDFGLPFFLQRESAAKSITYNQFLNTFYIRFITIFFYTTIPFIYFSDKLNNISIILLIITINFVYGFGSLLQGVLNGFSNYKANFIAFVISRTIYFTSLGIAYYIGAGVEIYLIMMIVVLFIQINFQYRLLGKVFKKTKKYALEFSIIKEILKSSLPIGASLIFVVAYDRIDVLLIEKFIDLDAVAIYAVAYALYRNSSIFSNIFLVRAYTDFSESFAKKGLINFDNIKSVLSKLLILGTIAFIFFYLFPVFLIKNLYGKNFIESADLLKILSLSIPVVFMNNFTGVILNSIRKEKIPMITTAIAVVINVALNLILIPDYNVFGAVYATIITEIIVGVMQFCYLFELNSSTKFIK